MTRIVMKFGGKALADAASMRQAATHIVREAQRWSQIIVVPSASAGTTDHLIESVQALTPTYDKREYDMVVASGEQITAGLLAILLKTYGLRAQTCLGWQVPIVTNDTFGSADIIHIGTQKLEALLQDGVIPIVAGFQGVTSSGHISTLGRGGSDLTATALASYLKADTCDFYKDVGGVYSANPYLVKHAHRFEAMDYANLLRMVQLGARILAPKAVMWAMHHQVPLRVFSFLDPIPQGTVINAEIPEKAMRLMVVPDATPQCAAAYGTLYCLGLPLDTSFDDLPVELVSRTPALTELRVPTSCLVQAAESLYACLEPIF